jgi:hypothetical protein
MSVGVLEIEGAGEKRITHAFGDLCSLAVARQADVVFRSNIDFRDATTSDAASRWWRCSAGLYLKGDAGFFEKVRQSPFKVLGAFEIDQFVGGGARRLGLSA